MLGKTTADGRWYVVPTGKHPLAVMNTMELGVQEAYWFKIDQFGKPWSLEHTDGAMAVDDWFKTIVKCAVEMRKANPARNYGTMPTDPERFAQTLRVAGALNVLVDLAESMKFAVSKNSSESNR